MAVPRPIALVCAAAAANSETASGLVPPTVDQTAGKPCSSARTIAARVAAAFGLLTARPARSGATVDHLLGRRGRTGDRVPRTSATLLANGVIPSASPSPHAPGARRLPCASADAQLCGAGRSESLHPGAQMRSTL